jgi:hypothetical protein
MLGQQFNCCPNMEIAAAWGLFQHGNFIIKQILQVNKLETAAPGGAAYIPREKGDRFN